MAKINVLQICDHLGWPGSRMHGVKRLFVWMIPRFDRERFNVSLVSLRQRDTSGETLESHGIDVTYLHKSKFDPATLPALLKVIDRSRADILHMHGYGATTFGRLAAARRGLPAILHEHANHTDTPWFQKLADKALAPYTDLAIAVSRSTAEFVVRARQVPAERTKVVYLGAPVDEFARPSPADVAAARERLGVPPGALAIGTITRLMPSKGNRYFVEAARTVADRVPAARFYVVGEGELREPLEARMRGLGLADRFTFTGYMNDVRVALAALDIVVFPSLWEGTPLTAFEALAVGKPIVASDADGLADILTGGHDALVVRKADAAALAEAIVALAADPDRRAALGARAAETGRRYDIASFVRKMERLYTILHETSRRTRRAGILSADLGFLTGAP